MSSHYLLNIANSKFYYHLLWINQFPFLSPESHFSLCTAHSHKNFFHPRLSLRMDQACPDLCGYVVPYWAMCVIPYVVEMKQNKIII